MEGLITEAESMLDENAEPEVMDAILISLAQKVEHYEIASYGTLATWAKLLGNNDAHKLLGATLNEEENTDKKLSELAETINASSLPS